MYKNTLVGEKVVSWLKERHESAEDSRFASIFGHTMHCLPHVWQKNA